MFNRRRSVPWTAVRDEARPDNAALMMATQSAGRVDLGDIWMTLGGSKLLLREAEIDTSERIDLIAFEA